MKNVYFGNSITAGATGCRLVLGEAGVYYPWLLAAALGEPEIENHAVGGNLASQQAWPVYQYRPADTERRHYLSLGTVECVQYSAVNQSLATELFEMIIAAEIAWLSSDVSVANGPAWTWQTGWDPLATYGTSPSIAMKCRTNGAYGEVEFEGDVCLIGYTLISAHLSTVGFELSIDSGAPQFITMRPPTPVLPAPPVGPGYAPALARIAGCGSGTHTARVTAVTDGLAAVVIDWIAGASNGIPLYVLTLPYVTADPDAMVDGYNAALIGAAANAAADGMNVILVDSGSMLDRHDDIGATLASGAADGRHPNGHGHIKMMMALRAAIGL